jgi:amidase
VTGAITVESTAREMARAVRKRKISARDLLDLHPDRIEERIRASCPAAPH